MADDVKLLEKCAECGVDVREGTVFCYNCGKSVVAEAEVPQSETEPEIQPEETADDTAKLEEADSSARRASAAIERKRSRVGSKKKTKVVWEAPGPAADRIYLLLCVLLFVIAFAIVALTTFIR